MDPQATCIVGNIEVIRVLLSHSSFIISPRRASSLGFQGKMPTGAPRSRCLRGQTIEKGPSVPKHELSVATDTISPTKNWGYYLNLTTCAE